MKRKNRFALKIMSAIIIATVLLSGCSEQVDVKIDNDVASSVDTAGNSQIENSNSAPQETSLPTESLSEPEVNLSTAETSAVQSTVASSPAAASETTSSVTVSSTTISSTKPPSSTTTSTTTPSTKPPSSTTTPTKTPSTKPPSSTTTPTTTPSTKPPSSTTTPATIPSTEPPPSTTTPTTIPSTEPPPLTTTPTTTPSTEPPPSTTTSTSKPEVTPGLNENEIHKVLISFKDKYPEGTPWTNETRVYNSYTIFPQYSYYTGRGCAAFALELSDAAFGNFPAKEHYDISKIRVGDILRINNNTHSVIVLKVNSDSVVIAEGNFNNAVHWGREFSIADLKERLTYIWTRYP